MAKDIITTDEANQAVKMEAEAKKQPDTGVFTYQLKKPLEHHGHTVKELHFDFDRLTGGDYIAIDGEMVRQGQTLIVPEYSSTFLTGVVVRACTDRDENDIRIVDIDFMKALPIREYKKIIGAARSFFLRQA